MNFKVDGSLSDLGLAVGRYGVRVVIGEKGQKTSIHAAFDNVSVETVLQTMAGYFGGDAEVWQREGYVYVGGPTDQDRYSRAFTVPDSQSTDWANVYKIAGSAGSEVAGSGDLVVVRDTLQGLRRVAAVQSSVSVTRVQYEVQVAFVYLDDKQIDDWGVTLSAAGLSQIGVVTGGASTVAALLQAMVHAQASNLKSSDVELCKLLVSEGGKNTFQSGDVIAVPRNVVNDVGTVSSTGFDTINAGTTVTVAAHSNRSGFVRLDVDAQVASVVGYVQSYPTLNTRHLTSSCFLGDGGIAVIGGLASAVDSDARDRVPGIRAESGRSMNRDHAKLYLFVGLKRL